MAVDIGNSRIKYGLFANSTPPIAGQLPECQWATAVGTEIPSIPWDGIQAAGGGGELQCIVSSVNPPVLSRFLDEYRVTGRSEPTVIRSYTQLPIRNLTSPPEQTGIDRLLKGVAGNLLRFADQPMILVDSGTATTVDLLNESGEFAGGAILPGLSLGAQALHDHTAQLPLIETEELRRHSPRSLGRNTQEALRSGLYWGHVGSVWEVIRRLSSDHPGAYRNLLITGGAGGILAHELVPSTYCRDLTLQGLAVTAGGLV